MSGISNKPCDSCEAVEAYNPKVGLNGNSNNRSQAFGELCDPIGDEIKSVDDLLKGSYKKYPWIPFFEESDASLRLFRKMKDLSPTLGGVIKNQGDYTLGSGFVIKKKKEAGFILQDEEDSPVSDDEAKDVIEWLKSLHPSGDAAYLFEDIAKGYYDNYRTFGNGFVESKFFEIAGKKYAVAENLDAEYCKYLATPKLADKVILISPCWDESYLNENIPDMVLKYPLQSEDDDGTKRSVFHGMNKVSGRKWYGLPDHFNSLYFQYLELQLGQFMTEGYANEFTPRTIIEYTSTQVEAEGVTEGKGTFEEAMRDAYTNKGGKKKKFMTRRRMPGEDPMTVTQLQANNDHEFHIGMSAEAERQIIKSLSWHKVLLGIPTSGKLGSENEFDTVFKNKYKTIISAMQKKVLDPINAFLAAAAEYTDRPDMLEYSLGFEDQLTKILDAETEENDAV